jgi:hypothetical protein
MTNLSRYPDVLYRHAALDRSAELTTKSGIQKILKDGFLLSQE